MKKFFTGLFIVIALLVAAVAVGALYYAPQIKRFVEVRGSKAIHGQIIVGKVSFTFWPPLAVELRTVVVKREGRPKIDFKSDDISCGLDFADILKGHLLGHLHVVGPELAVTIPESTSLDSATDKVASHQGSGRLPQLPIPLGLEIQIEKARLKISQGEQSIAVNDLNFHVVAPSLTAPWQVTTSGGVSLSHSPLGDEFEIPVKIQSQLLYAENAIQTENTELDLGGLTLQLKGKSALNEDEHQWDGVIDIPELKNLKVPPKFLPSGTWSGLLQGKFHAERKQANPWLIQGHFEAQNVRGDFAVSTPALAAEGVLVANAGLDFTFQKVFSFNNLTLTSDLTDLGLHYDNSFLKSRGVPLQIDFVGAGTTDNFSLTRANLLLSTLHLSAEGKVNTVGGNSDIRLTLPHTSLVGLEKFFPALASHPLSGSIELRGSLRGNVKTPETLFINLNPLTLEKVQAGIDWVSSDRTKKVTGPVSLNGKLVVVSQGAKVTAALAQVQGDLTSLDIVSGESIHKKAGSLLKLSLKAQERGTAFQISEGVLKTAAGTLLLTGSIQNTEAPQVNLQLKIPRFDLAAATKIISAFPGSIAGIAMGSFGLTGVYDLHQGIELSPLQLSGELSVNLPRFAYTPPRPKVGMTPKAIAEREEESSTFLPPWPLMQQLKFTGHLTVGDLSLPALQASGVDAHASVGHGRVLGDLKMAKVFGGSFSLSQIQTSLTESQPGAGAQLMVKNIELAQALSWGAPEWKDLAKGQTSGNMTIHIPWYKRHDFLTKTDVFGAFQIKNGFLSTLRFDKYLNDKLASLPGLGGKNLVSTKGTSMEVTSQFRFRGGQLQLSTFNVMTPAQDELQSSGVINLDQTVDLKGQVFLASAPVAGDLKKCLGDSKGRIQIPIHLTGPATQPDYNLGSGTLQQIGSRLLTCQGQTEVKKQIDAGKQKLLQLLGH